MPYLHGVTFRITHLTTYLPIPPKSGKHLQEVMVKETKFQESHIMALLEDLGAPSPTFIVLPTSLLLPSTILLCYYELSASRATRTFDKVDRIAAFGEDEQIHITGTFDEPTTASLRNLIEEAKLPKAVALKHAPHALAFEASRKKGSESTRSAHVVSIPAKKKVVKKAISVFRQRRSPRLSMQTFDSASTSATVVGEL